MGPHAFTKGNLQSLMRKGQQPHMPATVEAAKKSASPKEVLPSGQNSSKTLDAITVWLDEAKAENIVTIDIKGKSSIGDYMVIATGRSDRHVGAIADQLQKKLKENELAMPRVEGKETCDWVLIDTGDIIVHVFRPEVREFYNLEKMWSAEMPGDPAAH
jgi:ribosome-associated protein